jgi:hypothetical protein
MESWQNLAKSETSPGKPAQEVAQPKSTELSAQQQMWIDFNALGGLITDIMQEDDNGKPMVLKRMTISKFAELIGVSRETLRLWRDNIPDFWVKVNTRRIELSSASRLQQMHDVWYRSALLMGKDGFRDRQLWLRNFMPDFKVLNEKEERKENIDSWAALISSKAEQIAANAIEGEIVADGNAQV